MQAYPDLGVTNGPEKFVPKLYGFKIFGMKGSKYEMAYDPNGQCINETEVKEVLENKRTDAYTREVPMEPVD